MTSIASRCRIAAVSLGFVLLAGPTMAQVDLSGEWTVRYHEDRIERIPGPEIGDFLGLPLTEGGRQRGMSWSPSLLTVPEHQCIPHPASYFPTFSNVRIWKEVEPSSQQIVAWHLLGEAYNRFRTIYMDGRPRPSDDMPYTWQGFSTGRWVNNMLEVTTTHMKAARIRRNGIEHSDSARLVEYIARHGGVLTFVSVLTDPATLVEPFVLTRNFVFNPSQAIRPYPCRGVVEVERPAGEIPHYLPGQNPFLSEFAEWYGLPLETALGGAETAYPEYIKRLEALGADAVLNPGKLRGVRRGYQRHGIQRPLF